MVSVKVRLEWIEVEVKAVWVGVRIGVRIKVKVGDGVILEVNVWGYRVRVLGSTINLLRTYLAGIASSLGHVIL